MESGIREILAYRISNAELESGIHVQLKESGIPPKTIVILLDEKFLQFD